MGPLNRLFRSRHERLRDDLGAYVDGHLAGSARETIERHLAACASCRHEVEEWRATVSVLRRLPPIAAPQSFAITAPAAATRPDFWSTTLPSLRVASASLAALAIVATTVNLAVPLPERDISPRAPAISFEVVPARQAAARPAAADRAQAAAEGIPPPIAQSAASVPTETPDRLLKSDQVAPASLVVGAAAPIKPPPSKPSAIQAAPPKAPTLSYAPRRPTPTPMGIVDRAGDALSAALRKFPDARIPWGFVVAAAALSGTCAIGFWFGRRY